MQNFSITVRDIEFEVIMPDHFNDAITKVKTGFDYAEDQADDGIIPFNRRGIMVDPVLPLTIRSKVPDAESFIPDILMERLSKHVTKAIERKCRVTGIFPRPDREVNGQFEVTFDVTFVVLK